MTKKITPIEKLIGTPPELKGAEEGKYAGIDFENYVLEDLLEKYTGITAKGWNVAVLVYEEHVEKLSVSAGGIIKPGAQKTVDESGYKNCVGLVVKISNIAYKDERYPDGEKWCELGDFVVFPRHAGYRISYKGDPIFILKEDQIDLVVDDPRGITR